MRNEISFHNFLELNAQWAATLFRYNIEIFCIKNREFSFYTISMNKSVIIIKEKQSSNDSRNALAEQNSKKKKMKINTTNCSMYRI